MEGNWVRRRRETLGLTLAEVAEYAGVSTARLALIETNRARPSLPTLYWLADRLGNTEVALAVHPFLSVPPSGAREEAPSQGETLF